MISARWIWGFAVALLGAQASAAGALDCHHARSRLDRVICAAPTLRERDAAMDQAYAKALRQAPGREAELRAGQTAWLSDREAACATSQRSVLERCLDAQYRFRLQVLASLTTAPAPAPVPASSPPTPNPAQDSLPAGSYLSDAVSFALQPDGRFEMRELAGSRQANGHYTYDRGVLTLTDARGDVGRTVFPLHCRVIRTATGFAVMLGQPECRPFDGLSFRMAE